MVSIFQALEIVVAVMILVGIIALFANMFSNTECDGLANATALALAEAINDAALENDVIPWPEGDVPPDDMTDYYTTVPIRLCEVNNMNTFAAQFSAQQPSYILTFEVFPPEGSISWGETQPFSGGAAESVLNYAAMKYGIKALTQIGSYTTRIIKKIGSIPKVIVTDFSVGKIGRKLTKTLDDIKDNRFVKWILSRANSGKAQKSVSETVDDVVNSKYYAKKHTDSGILDIFKDRMKKEDGDVSKALGNVDQLLETGIDGTPITVNGKKVIKQDYGDFVDNVMENVDSVEKQKILDNFELPSKYPWLTDQINTIKKSTSVPLKTKITSWWQDSSLKKHVFDNVKSLYDKIRGFGDESTTAFNKVFNYGKNTDPKVIAKQTSIVKEIALENKDKLRSEIVDTIKIGDDNSKLLLSQLEEATGKIFKKADDIADEDVILFINKYERWQNMYDLIEYVPRQQQQITGLASKQIGADIKADVNKIKKAASAGESVQGAFQDFNNKYKTPWDQLEEIEKQEWLNNFEKGYTDFSGEIFIMDSEDAGKVYETARLSMARKGLFDPSKVYDGTEIRTNWLIGQADKVENDMIVAQLSFDKFSNDGSKIIDYMVKPIITESGVDKFSGFTISSYIWQRVKKGVLLDLNRMGEGPIAPYNILTSPYDIEKALEKESEIKEGGCSDNSICMLQRSKPTGPVEGTSSYLLDRKVHESINVSLWRSNPEGSERVPIGVNTILMQASPPEENPRFYVVSPCFAIAKVWKDANTEDVYVYIDKYGSTKKCDVGECEQLPGLYSIDTPNFCYADEDYIWGTDNSPSELLYYGEFAGCVALCSAATSGSFKTCVDVCKYSAIGLLVSDATLATQAYRTSTWERQSSGWGYWNYQKAEDICDNIDMISTFTGGGGLFDVSLGSGGITSKFKNFIGSSALDKTKFIGGQIFDIDDVCYSLVLIGDTSLAWPVKTPAGEFWRKNAILGDDCMEETAGECLWTSTCDPFDDDSCPKGMICDNGTCKTELEYEQQ